MPLVHRLTDTNDAGAPVIGTKQTFFRDNGQPVATDGDQVASHTPFFPPHNAPVTTSGAPGFRINGIPVNRVGDPDDCGHARAATGSVTNLEGY
ncbi:hypothetical protein ATO13_22606 [Stappia sp. 22II-S9-Z10]|nr:hypothetical protein ATO13_22606 [Stappia sp. 22II-S9-Z10]